MNLFSKGSFHQVVRIGKFSSQLYIIIQLRRAINSWRLFQRLNPNQVVLRINTCRVKISYYTPRRVVRVNCSESIIRSSKVCSTLISRKRNMHIIPEVKDYAILIVCKSSLTQFNSVSNPTLVISKCSNIILDKFKIVKFML